MPYQGTMPTALLNDQKIRPTEYRKWRHAVERFERRDEDRKILADLKASIPQHGLKVPITLGVSDRYPDVYVAEGHHRAVALTQLGTPNFPFHWYWIRNYGVRIESTPFPYHLLGL
ncbi:ParB N-terminal domain-containing protein [Streptomyces sp. NBC_01353]|uniref:ParB N-terminal domain-containing protein n=1 Tax=Streptomyces sp. NBC_01353 TaxID=2903835 RepID=UPI002E342D76|nr:ParB N-terminal domain-containing protein [Streptomyces sp. NBC_01353]